MHFFARLCAALPALLLVVTMAPARAAEPIPVVASFSILGDIVAKVGAQYIAVTALVGPDQDAHVFQPSPADIKTVARARLVVINGLGFEGWTERLTQSAGYRGSVVTASSGILPRALADDHDQHDQHDHEHHHHGSDDPHAWQNPQNVVVYVNNIATALVQLDPGHAEAYRRNAQAYIAQLQELDRWAMQQFAQLAPGKRRVITSHDAFGYFGDHYKVRFLAAQGVSTDSGPSAREVAALIRQIRTEKIRALFFENMSNPRLLEQIAREAGVTPGGKLYADALSAKGGPAADYLGLMRYNINQLLEKIRLN